MAATEPAKAEEQQRQGDVGDTGLGRRWHAPPKDARSRRRGERCLCWPWQLAERIVTCLGLWVLVGVGSAGTGPRAAVLAGVDVGGFAMKPAAAVGRLCGSVSWLWVAVVHSS